MLFLLVIFGGGICFILIDFFLGVTPFPGTWPFFLEALKVQNLIKRLELDVECDGKKDHGD